MLSLVNSFQQERGCVNEKNREEKKTGWLANDAKFKLRLPVAGSLNYLLKPQLSTYSWRFLFDCLGY